MDGVSLLASLSGNVLAAFGARLGVLHGVQRQRGALPVAVQHREPRAFRFPGEVDDLLRLVRQLEHLRRVLGLVQAVSVVIRLTARIMQLPGNAMDR